MKEKKVNVAIYGSGIAGLTAAVTLLEHGVRDVCVFEKRPFQGGAISNTPMCFLAVKNDERYQDRAFKIHAEYTQFSGNMVAARAWINNSYRIPAFVESLGLEKPECVETPYEDIGRTDGYTGGFPFGMNLGDTYILKGRGVGHGAALICLRAVQKIRKLGGEVIFNTSLIELIKEEQKVTGAIVKEKNVGTYQVIANDVIVATGGIGNAAPEMLKEETGYIYTDREMSDGGNFFCNSFFNDQMTGDGLKAVWKIGGKKSPILGCGRHLAYPGIVNHVAWLVKNQLSTIMEQPYLVVNQKGKRFIDEGENRRSANMAAAMRQQPGRIAYLIFDDDTMDHLEAEGTEYFYMIFPSVKIENGREQFRKVIEEDHNKHIYVAPTLENLAEQTGIDKETLLETVQWYNELCDKGHDDDFAKDPAYMRPVRKANFYCMKFVNVNYSQIGGITVDEKCHVLDREMNPIGHLYAAGDSAASVIYGPHTPNVTSISSVAYTQGMICADNIAKEQHVK